MFVRLLTGAAVLLAALPAAARPANNPETQGKALAAACKGRDGWSDPAPPAHIFGRTYFVGTCGITVLLVTGRHKKHVLIDSGPPEAVPLILANIRRLGFRPRDVEVIIGSHEHADHMGGFAALKAATGAQIWLRGPARAVAQTGRTDPTDPQAGTIPDMPPVKVDDIFRADGEVINLVGWFKADGYSLTPVPTPGHTSGGTSYHWTECDKTRCLNLAYVDSLSAVSRDGYRFSDHPERVAPFRATFDRVAAMPCDILVTPHPGVSNLFARLGGIAPLVDPLACRHLAATAGVALDKRLAGEGVPPAK